MRRVHMLVVVAGLLLTAVAFAGMEPVVRFPKDYAQWRHARSMVITEKGHPLHGFHHVYVGPSAVEAYKTGKQHKEGAMLVVPFHEVIEKDGTIDQGALKMVAVMKKDKTAMDTGGWRYAAFGPDGKDLGVEPITGCFNCHASQKDRDYVFSRFP